MVVPHFLQSRHHSIKEIDDDNKGEDRLSDVNYNRVNSEDYTVNPLLEVRRDA